jgi:predicted  nucleic acid-binding Zn-ribbon protein
MTLAQLLVVQAHDTTIDQLHHRLKTLPEFDALKMMEDEKSHLSTQRAELAEQAHTFGRDQKKLEDDVALIEDRHNAESARLYSGTVTAHKDLEAIQHELETLERRQRTLEDQVIEVMELVDPVNVALADLDAKLSGLATRHAGAETSLAESQVEIAGLVTAEEDARAALAAEIDEPLLKKYEAARAQCGGVGVSRLLDKTCEGCHLQLPAVELDRIRKSDINELAYCDCGRILVHS